MHKSVFRSAVHRLPPILSTSRSRDYAYKWCALVQCKIDVPRNLSPESNCRTNFIARLSQISLCLKSPDCTSVSVRSDKRYCGYKCSPEYESSVWNGSRDKLNNKNEDKSRFPSSPRATCTDSVVLNVTINKVDGSVHAYFYCVVGHSELA